MIIEEVLKDFEQQGEYKVRLNLITNAYSKEAKRNLAENWLQEKEQARLAKTTRNSQIATACAVLAAIFTAMASGANAYFQYKNLNLKCITSVIEKDFKNASPH
jgi:hypothetical protein